MSLLFSPWRVRGLTVTNRAWVSAMCQYSATDGVIGDWHLAHLGSLATGGFGLVMAEATAVAPEARISVRCPGLWNDEQIEAWSRVTAFAHAQRTHIGVQLAHAGRKASTMAPWGDHPIALASEGGWTAVAPSEIAFDGYPLPRALRVDEIDHVVEQFADAAHRARRAGFDVLEIHAAHGYLLHQFLSPLSNRRDDAYGGSFANRTRLLRRVVEAVRAIDDDVALFVRLSATDWVEGGWDLDQTVALASELRELGVDLVDVSSGGNVADAVVPVGPGYQVPFAAAVRHGAGVATSAVGLITEPDQAEAILARGDADAVMVARAALRNPRWALNAAEALGEWIDWRPQLERARTVRASR